MLSKVYSSALKGIDAYLVEVEVDISKGMPALTIVGLPDAAVQESKERVRSAIKNSGYAYPTQRMTINLAPADVRKEGPSFDLPIALGLMSATRQINNGKFNDHIVLGELSLDGGIRPVSGVLPMALAAKEAGMKGMLLPVDNIYEAAIVGDIGVYPIESLEQAASFLDGEIDIEPYVLDEDEIFGKEPDYGVDFSEVKGQGHVKRAMEVAAAGGHNIIMVGPPGSGKTMLARRLPTILPNMIREEALETTKLHSVVGLLPPKTALLTTRPFRSPHHTISDAGLIGGGRIPRPGEVSLSHNGVLFLDELPEFSRNVLEVMRQPLEDGEVTISRAATTLTYPARFMLVAAMNPCPCGYYGDAVKECTCSPYQIQRYLSRISGPLLDRIDIHVEVPRLGNKEITRFSLGESSLSIRKRVNKARAIQLERFVRENIYCNAQMESKHIRKYCKIGESARTLLETAIKRLGLSARAYDRILKVSRTIADLQGTEDIEASYIAEAIQYRSLDRKFWT